MVDFARARRMMVDNQLRTSGITDWRILDAMNRVPREDFVPAPRRDLAYIDEPVALSPRRAIPAPAAFARLVQLAGIGKDDRVLSVGCGSGYGLAVLSKLAGQAVGLDDDADLVSAANTALSALGIDNARAVHGPLDAGAPAQAPFDAILIEGAVEIVPEGLFGQLREGGRLVAVSGTGNAAVATLYLKSGRDVVSRPTFNASLPPIGSFARAPQFQF